MNHLTTKDAARLLGVNVTWVRVMLANGKLGGMKFGRDWLVFRKSVERRIESMKGDKK